MLRRTALHAWSYTILSKEIYGLEKAVHLQTCLC